MERYHIGKEGFVWFLGVVEDRRDPEQIGRVRVRCFGWHTDDKTLIPTNTLPWAYILQAPNIPSSYTCREGDFVFGFFMDGDSAQQPMIVGVIPGKPTSQPDYSKGFSDPNRVYPKRINEPTLSRLALKSKYPKNWVHESELGHTFEIDDNGDGRVKLSHVNGTYVEFDGKGDCISVVKRNNKVTIAKDNTITIGGDCKISVSGDCSFSVKGTFSVSAEDVSINGKSSASLGGSSTSVSASSDLNVKGGSSLSMGSDGSTSVSGTTTTVGATVSVDIPAPSVGLQCGLPSPPTIFDKISSAISSVTGSLGNVASDLVSSVETTVSEISKDLGLDKIVTDVGTAIGDIKDVVVEIKKEAGNTFSQISKDLQPVTNLLDKANDLLVDIDIEYQEMAKAIEPVEKVLGKELFPHTEYFNKLNDYSNKIDRIRDPLMKLNDSTVELNSEMTSKTRDKVSNYDKVVGVLDKLNEAVHNANQYYNLSVPNNKKIPNLGKKINQKVPAEYGIKDNYEEANDYQYFQYIKDLLFGGD